jgi:hypothetical protein
MGPNDRIDPLGGMPYHGVVATPVSAGGSSRGASWVDIFAVGPALMVALFIVTMLGSLVGTS